MPFEFFEHTADLGLRVKAQDLDELLLEAARGLTAALVAKPAAIQPATTHALQVEGEADAPDYLLFDWLSELLYRFATEDFVGCEFELQRDPSGSLSATVSGERFDPQRHGAGQELKAVTYHGLKVEQAQDGWIAELVIDL